MHITVWRYRVPLSHIEEFRRAYGPDGAWATLFRCAAGYLRTELYEDVGREGHFVTFDIWASDESRSHFLREYQEEYQLLDKKTSYLTALDSQVGTIQVEDSW